MEQTKTLLENNVRLLKSRVSKYAMIGLIASFIMVLVVTLIVTHYQFGEITFFNAVKSQQSNFLLWILDLTPLIFAVWGQNISNIIANEAGAMIVDQTNELKLQASVMEKKMLQKTMHDALTELPNRILFNDRLTQSITRSRDEDKSFAIYVLDIKSFKDVNDAFGHHNGDRVLKQIAARLSSVIQDPNTVARLSGNEFAVLATNVMNQKEITAIAKKVQLALDAPFSLDGISLEVNACMGICTFPEHGSDADTLMQRGDIALQASKRNNSQYTLYSNKIEKNNSHKYLLMSDLRYAIDNDELVLRYQPQVSFSTNKITGVEALLHWEHQHFGVISAEEFIPLAERTGLIKVLTRWVLNESIRQCALWHEKGVQISVAVNLSMMDTLNVELPDIVMGLLVAHSLKPEYLILELTESAFISDKELTLDILNRLSSLGIKLSIDDFGTGYSSLAYLAKLPVSEVKIDKSFVIAMSEESENAAIVRAIVSLAHNLNLKVTAEGIEEKNVYNEIVRLQCDYGQGFYISRPKAADDIEAYYREWNAGNMDFGTEFELAPSS